MGRVSNWAIFWFVPMRSTRSKTKCCMPSGLLVLREPEPPPRAVLTSENARGTCCGKEQRCHCLLHSRDTAVSPRRANMPRQSEPPSPLRLLPSLATGSPRDRSLRRGLFRVFERDLSHQKRESLPARQAADRHKQLNSQEQRHSSARPSAVRGPARACPDGHDCCHDCFATNCLLSSVGRACAPQAYGRGFDLTGGSHSRTETACRCTPADLLLSLRRTLRRSHGKILPCGAHTTMALTTEKREQWLVPPVIDSPVVVGLMCVACQV